jgi:hypothetical protein
LELSKILGLPLQEGIEAINELHKAIMVDIKETHSTKEDKKHELIEPRILRVSNTNSMITIVVGYF